MHFFTPERPAMKIGLSSYSFRPMLNDGRMTLETLFDWLKQHGAEHLEIATFSFATPGTEAGLAATRTC
jgi:L-ribulose-5-phosphate 3-epimerase